MLPGRPAVLPLQQQQQGGGAGRCGEGQPAAAVAVAAAAAARQENQECRQQPLPAASIAPIAPTDWQAKQAGRGRGKVAPHLEQVAHCRGKLPALVGRRLQLSIHFGPQLLQAGGRQPSSTSRQVTSPPLCGLRLQRCVLLRRQATCHHTHSPSRPLATQPLWPTSTHLHVFQQLLTQRRVVLLPGPLTPLQAASHPASSANTMSDGLALALHPRGRQARQARGQPIGCFCVQAGRQALRQLCRPGRAAAQARGARACMRMRHCRRKWRRKVASRSCRPIRRLELRYLTLAPCPSPAPARGCARGEWQRGVVVAMGGGGGGGKRWKRQRDQGTLCAAGARQAAATANRNSKTPQPGVQPTKTVVIASNCVRPGRTCALRGCALPHCDLLLPELVQHPPDVARHLGPLAACQRRGRVAAGAGQGRAGQGGMWKQVRSSGETGREGGRTQMRSTGDADGGACQWLLGIPCKLVVPTKYSTQHDAASAHRQHTHLKAACRPQKVR